MTSTDLAGNKGGAVTKSFTLDTTSQLTITGLTDSTDSYIEESSNDLGRNDQITKDKTPDIEGTAEAFSTIALTINNQTYNTTANADGEWVIKIQQALEVDGDYNYSVVATDIAGNVSSPQLASLTIDTTAPQTLTVDLAGASDSGASDSDGITNNQTPTFTGSSEAGAYIVLTIDGNSYTTTADEQGNWTVQVDNSLGDAKHEYTVTATDAADNTTTLSGQTITVETNANDTLTARLATASDTGFSNSDATTKETLPIFNGESGNGDTITLNIAGQTFTTTADNSGHWSIDLSTDSGAVPLAHGNHTYTVESLDLAGNTSQTENTLRIDIINPNPFTGGWM